MPNLVTIMHKVGSNSENMSIKPPKEAIEKENVIVCFVPRILANTPAVIEDSPSEILVAIMLLKMSPGTYLM